MIFMILMFLCKRLVHLSKIRYRPSQLRNGFSPLSGQELLQYLESNVGSSKTSSRHNMYNVGTCIQHFTQKSLICVDIYRNLMKLALPLFCRPNLASFRSTADVSVRACVKRIPCLSVKLKTICRPFVSICQGISAALSIYFLSNGFAHSIVVHHSTSHLDLSVWS